MSLDLLDPQFRADPFPTFARLRAEQPVARVEPGGMWAVSRYDDVQAALRDTQTFSSAGFRAELLPDWLERNPVADSMLLMDPPEHGRIRGLIQHAFTPGATRRMEQDIARAAQEWVDRMPTEGTVDFLETLALPFPAQVIIDLTGMSRAMTPHFKRWCDHLTQVSTAITDPEHREAIRTSLRDLAQALRQGIENRRADLQDDLLSHLIRTQQQNDELTDDDLLNLLFLLIPAGFETTMGLLCAATRQLAADPEEGDRLRAQPDRIDRFIEEILRFEPPNLAMMRLVLRDTELSGTPLPRGSVVFLMTASANRDERRFSSPEQFIVDREDQGHISFGYGAHFCLGARLARLEARLALQALLERYERFIFLDQTPQWLPSLSMRHVQAQPMKLIPRRTRAHSEPTTAAARPS